MDKQYRQNMQDNDLVLVNPIQINNPILEFMGIAFKFFSKEDKLLHSDIHNKPDFIMNDNKLIVIFLQFEYHVQYPTYLINKIRGVR